MASSSEWFVALRNGSVVGPLSEAKFRADLLSGKIPSDASIRQGNSRWHSAEEILQIVKNLHANGWYIKKLNGTVKGPFTEARLRQLKKANRITDDTLVRVGSRGNWAPMGLLTLRVNGSTARRML